jgi:hypothetical protein
LFLKINILFVKELLVVLGLGTFEGLRLLITLGSTGNCLGKKTLFFSWSFYGHALYFKAIVLIESEPPIFEQKSVMPFPFKIKPQTYQIYDEEALDGVPFDWLRLVCFANKNKNCHVIIQLITNQSNRRSMVQ